MVDFIKEKINELEELFGIKSGNWEEQHVLTDEQAEIRKFFEKALKEALQQASDGYHTFDELYEHRAALFTALCGILTLFEGSYEYSPEDVWRSKQHSDGTMYEGWFVAGISKKKGRQITYHFPLDKWNDFDFAQTLKRAPKFDGHTSSDVLERLKEL